MKVIMLSQPKVCDKIADLSSLIPRVTLSHLSQQQVSVCFGGVTRMESGCHKCHNDHAFGGVVTSDSCDRGYAREDGPR